MAKIGMLYPKYSVITIGTDSSSGAETETYGDLKVMGKAVRASVTINTAEAKLYADDGLAEMVKEFVEGSISAETDDMEDSVAADLYGATMTQADGGTAGKIVYKDTDSSAYLRFGFIVRRMKANKMQYKAIVYTKVMFDIPNEDYETKGETIVFKTNSVTGKIMRNKDRIWKITSLWVDTIDAAETFLDANVKPLTA